MTIPTASGPALTPRAADKVTIVDMGGTLVARVRGRAMATS